MKYTAIDLVNELEKLQAKWNDEICILIEGDPYKFALDAGSMYTEVLNGRLNIEVVDADVQYDKYDDTRIIETVQDLKTFFMDKSISMHFSTDIKTLPIYFLAAELNDDDPDIEVFGWKKIQKQNNQILITVSKDLKSW